MATRLRTLVRTLGTSAALVAGTVLVAVPAASAAAVPQWLVTSQAVSLVNGYLGDHTLTTNALDVSSTLMSGSRPSGWVTTGVRTFEAYGPAMATGSLLYAVACTIDANRAGNADWAPAPEVSQTVTVSPKGCSGNGQGNCIPTRGAPRSRSG